jgi:hypothetical protein
MLTSIVLCPIPIYFIYIYIKTPGSVVDVSNGQCNILLLMGAVVVVIAWQFDLQLPMQSVPITTKVVGSNPTYGEVVLDIDNVIKVASDLRLVSCFLWVFWFTPSIKLTTTI